MIQKLSFLFCLFISLQASAGGWLQNEKEGYFKLGQTIIHGNQFYNGEGKQTDIITTGVYLTSLYGEYGLSKKFNLIGYIPFLSRSVVNAVRFESGAFQEGDELTSFGDSDIGIKYGIRQNKSLVISASLVLGLPLGNAEGGESGLLQTGDGEFNQLVTLSFGYGFNFPLYLNVDLGFNNRTKGFSEEIRAAFELGYVWNKKVIIAAKFSTVQSLMNGEPTGSSGNGIFSNNLEYVSFGPEISYRINEKLGLTASYFSAASGRFVLAEPAYGLGIFMELK